MHDYKMKDIALGCVTADCVPIIYDDIKMKLLAVYMLDGKVLFRYN